VTTGAISLHHGPDLGGKCNIGGITFIATGVVFCSLGYPCSDQLNLIGIKRIIGRGRHQVVTIVRKAFEKLAIVRIPGFDFTGPDNGGIIGENNPVSV